MKFHAATLLLLIGALSGAARASVLKCQSGPTATYSSFSYDDYNFRTASKQLEPWPIFVDFENGWFRNAPSVSDAKVNSRKLAVTFQTGTNVLATEAEAGKIGTSGLIISYNKLTRRLVLVDNDSYGEFAGKPTTAIQLDVYICATTP